MMNRREFLGTSIRAGAALALLGPRALRASTEKPDSALRLTILQTNDIHSHLDPMRVGKFAGYGGAPVRQAWIEQMRATRKHVLLLDSGDIFQGTPYFNLFRGEADFRIMSAQNYVASTIGNHDFDAGIERLAEVTRSHAKFPFLNCNYDFRDTPMKGLTRESMVVECDGLRIGLLGLGIKLHGLVQEHLYLATQYRDPIADARRVAQRLRHDEKCDFIVCLSHINRDGRDPDKHRIEPGDRDLIVEVPEIDVVLGGHNHYLLDVPEEYERPNEGTGYVTQTGWAGTHIGLYEFDVFARGKRELASAGPVAMRGREARAES